MALEQCRRFLGANPQIKRAPAEDTAGSVARVVAQGDPTRAAIAGRRAARQYGGVILRQHLEDSSENYTRFLLISPSSAAAPRPSSSEYKTTIVFSVANAPGALYHSLRPFAERRIDLAKIESRPLRGSPFEYLFYLDLLGRAEASPISEALAELRSQATSLRVLGTYPRFTG